MCSTHCVYGTFLTRELYGTYAHHQLPGLGYLYSGLTRRKNALSLLFLSIVSLAIVSFQWFFIGYSLVFSESGGTFLGDGAHVGFRGVLDQPVPETNGRLPAIVFATYQMVRLLTWRDKVVLMK
jgi:ammonia channel protein AmtB